MLYKIYPLILWTLCFIFLAVGVCITVATKLPWTLLLWPVPSGMVARFMAAILVRRFPRIRYINSAEVDGLGYLHQPLNVVIASRRWLSWLAPSLYGTRLRADINVHLHEVAIL